MKGIKKENIIKFINYKIFKEVNQLYKYIKRRLEKVKNKFTIWRQTDKARGYKEVIIDILLHGLIFNAAVTILSKGWFSFNPFTIIGWGCLAHIIHEYPKFWVEEILRRK